MYVTQSVHFKASVRLITSTVLSDGNVLVHGTAYLETHRVLHFLFNTSTISQDQDYVDADEHTDDQNEKLGGHRVRSLHRNFLNFDPFPLVEIDAYFRLVDQVCANVLQDVLRGYIATESNPVNCH